MAEYTGKKWGEKLAEFNEVSIKDILGNEETGNLVEAGEDYCVIKYNWKKPNEKDVLYHIKNVVSIEPIS